MKEMTYQDLQQIVHSKKDQVNREILEGKNERSVRRRPRDSDESTVLDKLCAERWKQAERDGKVKYLSEKEWYYEPID